jgi:hypothetical protein
MRQRTAVVIWATALGCGAGFVVACITTIGANPKPPSGVMVGHIVGCLAGATEAHDRASRAGVPAVHDSQYDMNPQRIGTAKWFARANTDQHFRDNASQPVKTAALLCVAALFDGDIHAQMTIIRQLLNPDRMLGLA